MNNAMNTPQLSAGLYLHIPFCKQACHYCNFHFSTSLRLRDELTNALVLELQQRQEELANYTLGSIYLGGGTPSLLSEAQLNQIFQTIYRLFRVSDEAEITLEANPDDLSDDQLAAFRRLPINRLSIGIQSFSEADLRFMNRAHDAREAHEAVDRARAYNFDALTIDLMYGTQTMSDDQWAKNIQLAIELEVPHLSCYALTVEPQTALQHFVKTGKEKAVDEEQASRQFLYLIDTLVSCGYEHYEINSFAKAQRYSVHNTNYWTGKPYVGIGPSAHSFDGQRTRRWNVAHNPNYLKGVVGTAPLSTWYETEILAVHDQYNEYVMTRLRTKWGCSLTDIAAFGTSYVDHFLANISQYSDKLLAQSNKETFCLNKHGMLLADRIASDLFYLPGA